MAMLRVMRLELGRRADYAIRATVDLARHHGGGRRKARAIAEEMAIPSSYVPQIMAELVRAGLVDSLAGRTGGYSLARSPEQTSLLDVIEAVESEGLPATCILRGGPCRWSDVCAVHVPWSRAQDALVASLASTSLAELVAIDVAIEDGSYVIPDDVARPETGPGTTA